MPVDGADDLPRRGVAHLDRLIPAGGGDPPAVRAERHAEVTVGIPLDGADDLPGRGVPHLDQGSSDANDQALMAILAEWQSTVAPSSIRAAKTTAGVGPMLAKLVNGTTVFTDNNPNTLNG